ncbi:MAG: hypothetical protein KDA75_19565, partial [Planctomycetaceae bacterium]|nr:hypothetical protein [Planctomycetaceae bacterium]
MSGAKTPHYWKSLPVLNGPPADRAPPAAGDRNLSQPPGLSRRRFLEAAGFSLSLTAMVGCSRTPVEIALPLVDQPEGVVPGRALHYATTCGGCSAGCGL